MNLQALQTELMARGYDYLPTLRQTYFINRAYTEYCLRYPWPGLEVKVSGQALPFTPDPTLRAMLWLVDDKNARDLEGVDYREVRRLDPAGTQTGTPYCWFFDGSTIDFYPHNTDTTASFRYVQIPPALSATTDSPLVPPEFQLLIVDRAVVEALLDVDEIGAAIELRTDWEHQVDRIAANVLHRNYANNASIQGGYLGW